MTTDTEVTQPVEQEAEHLEWVNVSDLNDDPDNLRESYDGIEDLAASIKAHGLKQPIVCHTDSQGKFWIEAGHRRKRALVLAGKSKTRVIVLHRQPLPEERIATMLIENSNRKDLNPMEQSYGLERIRQNLQEQRDKTTPENEQQRKVTDKEVGDYIGRPQVWVTDRVKLLALDPAQQKAVREGRMTIGEGKRIGRLNTGATRPGASGKKGAGYFVSSHSLGTAAARRCESLNHKPGGPNYVAIACGVCWEHVIRADERTRNQRAAISNGHCATCNQPLEKENNEG